MAFTEKPKTKVGRQGTKRQIGEPPHPGFKGKPKTQLSENKKKPHIHREAKAKGSHPYTKKGGCREPPARKEITHTL